MCLQTLGLSVYIFFVKTFYITFLKLKGILFLLKMKMKSLKRKWTLRPLSESKMVMWMSHVTVTSKYQDRYPAGQLWKHPSGSQSRSQDCSKAPHLPGPVGTRAVQNQVLHDPYRESWHRCRERPRTGETADCLLPLLISPCPVSGSGSGWGMYWLYPSP